MLCELESKIWELLKLQLDGISEYELLRQLQNELEDDFGPDLFRDELKMYRAHFLLFHALYRLSDYLSEKQLATLDIHVLKIKILPYETHRSNSLSIPDPLREHYLNLDNLRGTTLDDVKTLLGKFWTSYYADQKKPLALKVLGLQTGASKAEIEKRYRTMAMQHHPDRGGDDQDFLRLQQAISTLRQCNY
jgi:DnaJ-domain-containing protein 1